MGNGSSQCGQAPTTNVQKLLPSEHCCEHPAVEKVVKLGMAPLWPEQDDEDEVEEEEIEDVGRHFQQEAQWAFPAAVPVPRLPPAVPVSPPRVDWEVAAASRAPAAVSGASKSPAQVSVDEWELGFEPAKPLLLRNPPDTRSSNGADLDINGLRSVELDKETPVVDWDNEARTAALRYIAESPLPLCNLRPSLSVEKLNYGSNLDFDGGKMDFDSFSTDISSVQSPLKARPPPPPASREPEYVAPPLLQVSEVERAPTPTPPGTRVRVVELQQRTELNGSLATVVEWVEAIGRWKVRMDDGSRKTFRPENLELHFGEGLDRADQAQKIVRSNGLQRIDEGQEEEPTNESAVIPPLPSCPPAPYIGPLILSPPRTTPLRLAGEPPPPPPSSQYQPLTSLPMPVCVEPPASVFHYVPYKGG
eukprot:gnl/TRDRNA2_/TRDRNA2_44291_c0_seq1.p1 gnl/TRDRNA2_/TRDRNA2_44291_c0~~gnl/TRDRNA2_/TRDRNA2_44291_c0_seq1.p1  ORF type:complete len:419 (-),score=78.31 gnl/TRDRNA2_/TRDRNA2_44291_c0_seq1:130-1386(-)